MVAHLNKTNFKFLKKIFCPEQEPQMRSTSNFSWNSFKNIGITSSTVISLPFCLETEVTPLPISPQGTISLKPFKSLLQFRANPCIVTLLSIFSPKAQILSFPIQIPVSSDCWLFKLIFLFNKVDMTDLSSLQTKSLAPGRPVNFFKFNIG